MQKLPNILSPDVVYQLPEEEIKRIASENEEIMSERLRLSEKLSILENGLNELNRLKKYGLRARSNTQVGIKQLTWERCMN